MECVEDGGLRIAIFYSRSSILDFVYYLDLNFRIPSFHYSRLYCGLVMLLTQ
jgi:hypothetical protein